MRAGTLKKDLLKIGGASGYWGDASQATEQLLRHDDLDFIVYDYLAEITMAIICLLNTSPSPRDDTLSRMPSSA